MANLLIGFSEIPFDGTVISTPTIAPDYRGDDVNGGARNRTVKIQTASTTSAWSWQLTQQTLPQYLYIARADLIARNDSAPTAFAVEGDDDPLFSSPDLDDGVFSIGDLKGPRREDLIFSITKTSARSCWRVSLTTTQSFKHEISKIFLGRWLDLVRDPIYPAQISRDPLSAMPRAVPWRFSLEWVGIPDAKIEELTNKVLRFRDVNPVILYDTNDVVFSSSFKVLHAYITNVEITPEWVNANRLRMDFQETI